VFSYLLVVLPWKISPLLTFLSCQYLLTTVEGGLTDLLSFGVIRPSTSGPGVKDPTRSVRLSIKAVCEELLPEAIGLTDAFGFTDWDLDRYGDFLAFSNLTIKFTTKNVLYSALGVYNGKVYEALWERTKAEPLNLTEVPAAYEVRKCDTTLLHLTHICPFLRHLSSLSLSGGGDWQLRRNYNI
jgi:acyl-CoA oxidase